MGASLTTIKGKLSCDGLIAGMSVVGEKMRTGAMFLPEVLQCVSVMKAAMETLTQHILGMSAMLTTTMLRMKKTIAAIAAANLREHVKIIIGGASVSQRFADEIGADGYAKDAVAALALVKTLLALTAQAGAKKLEAFPTD